MAVNSENAAGELGDQITFKMVSDVMRIAVAVEERYVAIRRDTGNPRVYFVVPIPVPVNTVPLRVGVRCLSRVCGGYP